MYRFARGQETGCRDASVKKGSSAHTGFALITQNLSRKPGNLPAQQNPLVNRPSMDTNKMLGVPWGKNKMKT